MARRLEQSPVAWARLREDVNCGLRRGAWYEVVKLTKTEAVVAVRRQQLPLPRQMLQTTFNRPARWSVVPRPQDATNVPSDWGSRYAVCPTCHSRAPIRGYSPDMRCPRCRSVHEVAWDEHYLR